MPSVKLKLDAIQAAPDSFSLYQLTIAGVGFKAKSNKRYNFYSHDGEYIGSAPTVTVESFISFMRRNFGIVGDPYPMNRGDENRPITFGWQDLIPRNVQAEWMEQLTLTPKELR